MPEANENILKGVWVSRSGYVDCWNQEALEIGIPPLLPQVSHIRGWKRLKAAANQTGGLPT